MSEIIDYDEIDELCRPLVKLFNHIGLTTKYCCEGHKDGRKFYIMFESSVTDDDIIDFLKEIEVTLTGQFSRHLVVSNGDDYRNLVYEIKCYDHERNHHIAKVDYSWIVCAEKLIRPNDKFFTDNMVKEAKEFIKNQMKLQVLMPKKNIDKIFHNK